jgi:regulator of protease activity HflC (stomatin/prohibitin superfamily)
VFVVVPEGYAYVVERLGRYHRTLEAGRHFIAPVLDAVRFRHSLRLHADELTDQCISYDNVTLTIVSVARWRIVNPQQASYAAADVREYATAIVRNAQREWIGRRSFDDVRSSTRELEAYVVRAVADAASQGGVEVTELTVNGIERS